jgi:GNAT superfamily N-acetyltransferase
MMFTASISSPSDCTEEALAEFERLVVQGDAVDPHGLAQRIRNAHRLLFLRAPDGALVGVGALKRPRPGYRRKVFSQAQADAAPEDYAVELGWVVVGKPYQGQRLSSRIVSELLALVRNENVFATARFDDRTMRLASAFGFKPNGKPFRGRGDYELVLYLRKGAETAEQKGARF